MQKKEMTHLNHKVGNDAVKISSNVSREKICTKHASLSIHLNGGLPFRGNTREFIIIFINAMNENINF